MITTGRDPDHTTAEDSNTASTLRGRRRLRWIAGIGAVTAVAVGLLVIVGPRQQPAHAGTPDPLPISASPGAPVTLDAVARAAGKGSTGGSGTVDYLLIDRWDLNSVIDGQDVTSAVFPSRRELWRTIDNQARTIDTFLPPQWGATADRDAFGDTGTSDGPVRSDYPAGTFPASFDSRPPTAPDELAVWLARSSSRDIAILNGVTDLLQERALTGPERAAVLTVLDTRTALEYAGTSIDRAGRPGAAFTLTSSASGGQSTYVLLLDADTGRFLAYEEVLTAGAPALKVGYPAVLSYRTYQRAETVAAIP
jgi:hypothetical protein